MLARRCGRCCPNAVPASEALKPFFAAVVGEYFIASTGYTGEDGYEITLPAAQADSLWEGSLRRACGRVVWAPVTRCASRPA
jgi:glycine cleavage system aminomethyltransferase T